MDYVFTQGSNHEWYLSALQESEMKPEATATPAPTANVPQDAQSMVEDQLGNAMADTSTVLNDDAASDTSAEEYTSADTRMPRPRTAGKTALTANRPPNTVSRAWPFGVHALLFWGR